MPAVLKFYGSGSGGSLPAPPVSPEVLVLVVDPLNPGVPTWRCLRSSDLCAIPPGFSVGLQGLTPSPLEIGAQLSSPQFNATYNNGVPTSATLSDNVPNAPQNVLAVPNPLTMPFNYSENAIGATRTFTLTADDGSGPESDNVTYTWLPRVYFGVGPNGLSTEADIEALPDSALAASFARTFQATPGVGEHIYYAFPASFGTPTFFVNNFQGGFILQAAGVNVTANTPGAPVNAYDLWKSVLPNLGLTTIEVV